MTVNNIKGIQSIFAAFLAQCNAIEMAIVTYQGNGDVGCHSRDVNFLIQCHGGTPVLIVCVIQQDNKGSYPRPSQSRTTHAS